LTAASCPKKDFYTPPHPHPQKRATTFVLRTQKRVPKSKPKKGGKKAAKRRQKGGKKGGKKVYS